LFNDPSFMPKEINLTPLSIPFPHSKLRAPHGSVFPHDAKEPVCLGCTQYFLISCFLPSLLNKVRQRGISILLGAAADSATLFYGALPIKDDFLVEQPSVPSLQAGAQVAAVRVVHDDAQHVAGGPVEETLPEPHDVGMGELGQQRGFFASLKKILRWSTCV